MEIILEDRLFIPLQEDIILEEPMAIEAKIISKEKKAISEKKETPSIKITLQKVMDEKLKLGEDREELVEEEPPKRKYTFNSLENPFKK